MKKQPLLIFFTAFTAGIFLQDFAVFSLPLIYLGLLSSILFLIATYLIQNFYLTRFRTLAFFMLIGFSGIFAHDLQSKKPVLPELDDTEVLTFKLVKKLNSNKKNRRYEIVAWKDHQPLSSILSQPKEGAELDFEHYYQAKLYVNKIEPSYHDFQFNYQKYLQRKHIYFQCYLPGELKIAPRTDLTYSEKVKQERLSILRKIDQSSLEKKTREFLKGIILADRTEMDFETVADFRDSGMMHLLAISGTHIAIIFGALLYILNLIIPAPYKNCKILLALGLIWSFATFIDFGNSVVRSCLMISTYYLFVILQRKTDLLHSLSLAGLIILIIDTNQIFDVGFQLSFTAVLGIFWFNQPLIKCLPKAKTKLQYFFQSIFSISIAAQLATMPLVIFYFHQYSAISILANLVIIPFAEILIILSLLMVALIAFSLQFIWLDYFFELLIKQTLNVIHFFARQEFSMNRLIPMTVVEVLLLFFILFLLGSYISKKKFRNALRVLSVFLLFLGLRFYLNHHAAHSDEILVHQLFKDRIISVKSGTDITFYTPKDVDAKKVQSYIIDPYLSSRRAKSFKLICGPQNPVKIKAHGRTLTFTL